MSIPPKYDDLGKEARDVFGKGYGKSSLTFLLPCFSVQINIKFAKNTNCVQQQREHHH